jgi:AraC-like DNA-binding protein
VLQKLIDLGPVMKMISLPRARQRLHTMPTSTGYDVRTDAGYSWDGRRRGQTPFTVMQHTISGTGNLRYGTRSYRIAPGETMLLVVPHSHRYWVEKGGRWEFFWISMHGAEALRIHREVLATKGPVFSLRAATIDNLADCAYRLVKGDGSTPARASAISYEAAMALYDDVFQLHGNDVAENSVVRQVTDYIGAHLHLPLPVDELARLSGLSRAHFSRVFAAHEGIPPAEFVLNRRLDRAAKLLTMSADLPVKDISGMCGFEDPNYFAKVFRRGFGVSPTEFRTTGMYASAGYQQGQISDR